MIYIVLSTLWLPMLHNALYKHIWAKIDLQGDMYVLRSLIVAMFVQKIRETNGSKKVRKSFCFQIYRIFQQLDQFKYGYSKATFFGSHLNSALQNGKYILKLQILKKNKNGAKTCHPKDQFATSIHFQSLVHSKKMALPLR